MTTNTRSLEERLQESSFRHEAAEDAAKDLAAKDKLLGQMDKLLARAADALNNGMRMSEMDLGREITEYRRANLANLKAEMEGK